MGINEKVVRELDVYIELVIGMTLTVVEGLLTKRLKDAERSISALSDALDRRVPGARAPRLKNPANEITGSGSAAFTRTPLCLTSVGYFDDYSIT